MIVLLASLTFGIIEAPGQGWTSPVIVGALAAAAVALVALLRYEPRRDGAAPRPALLPLDPVLGGDRHLGGRVRGVRRVPLPQHALPAGGPRPLARPGRPRDRADGRDDRHHVAAVGADRRPPRPSPAAGRSPARPASSRCRMLTLSAATTPLAWLLAAYVVLGLGFGFVNAPITNTAVSGMPRAQAGVAAAIADDLAPGRPDARRGRGRRDRRLASAGSGRGEPARWWTLAALRGGRARARVRGDEQPGRARRPGGPPSALNPEALAAS